LHPQCVHIIDLAKAAGGRTWQVIVAIGFLIQVIMFCSSAIVTISIAFNTMTEHAICTVGFMAVAAVISFLLCVPRTVKFISRSGPPTVISLVGAVLIVMISLGFADPVKAPEDWKPTIKAFNNPGFRNIFNAVLKIVFAYAGNHSYVSYMAEMKDPKKDFPFSLTWLIFLTTAFYTMLATGIYCLAGEYTTSPALGSAPHIYAKAAYGVVLPAILTGALANGHVGVKYMFIVCMKQMKATHEITSNSIRSWAAWMICTTIFWIISFILANAIPIFDSIVSIQSATTYAWFSFGMSGVFYIVSRKDIHFKGGKNIAFFALNVSIILFAFFLNGAGLWASLTEMLEIFATGDNVNGTFSCGDNSAL
jgi:amino acid transporter